ncbi:hypothetical protein [Lacihabitans sp. CCS-44]|uniref:hypothetical protein n=1 Tax=Lacihabitans sp. CCS-44 TaxID=2487331 RepID=UPI0020CC7205|nr:hypothetical protein [Lacihabitans sp. CCS-44]
MKRRPRFFVSIIAAILTFGALTAHFGWRHHNKHFGADAKHCKQGHDNQKSINQKNN